MGQRGSKPGDATSHATIPEPADDPPLATLSTNLLMEIVWNLNVQSYLLLQCTRASFLQAIRHEVESAHFRDSFLQLLDRHASLNQPGAAAESMLNPNHVGAADVLEVCALWDPDRALSASWNDLRTSTAMLGWGRTPLEVVTALRPMWTLQLNAEDSGPEQSERARCARNREWNYTQRMQTRNWADCNRQPAEWEWELTLAIKSGDCAAAAAAIETSGGQAVNTCIVPIKVGASARPVRGFGLYEQDTWLHVATRNLGGASAPVVRLLLVHGADPLAQNARGKSSIDVLKALVGVGHFVEGLTVSDLQCRRMVQHRRAWEKQVESALFAALLANPEYWGDEAD